MSLRDVRRVTVQITKADIANGLVNDSEFCPVALALRRAYPRVKSIAVEPTSVFMGQWSWRLNPAATTFIHRFDERLSVRPRKVTLVKEG